MFNNIDDIGLGVFRKVEDIWKAGRSDSLIDYTRAARVSPIALIDTDLVFDEMTPDIMQTMVSIFAGYYLQAVQLSSNVGRIEIMRHLDRLNPNRVPLDSATDSAGWLLATENYTEGLPTLQMRVGMEAFGELIVGKKNDDESVGVAITQGRDTAKEVKELSNMAFGKLLAVEISDGTHKATINVAVQLATSSLPSDRLVHILSIGNKDISLKERWRGFKSGRLSAIKDMIFCEDLIAEHRKTLMKDTDGIYSSMLERRNKNRLAAVFSANPSVAQASNIYVISRATADKIERENTLRFKSFKDREKIFANTYTMLFVIVDKDWNRATIYHRGIEQPTEVSHSDLKAANKGSGPSISDVLKAYTLGNAPSL